MTRIAAVAVRSHPAVACRAATLLCAALLAACSGGELVGVHIDLQKDGSGKVTTRALVAGRAEAAEMRATGVTWNGTATLVSRQGTFAKIHELGLGGATNQGMRFSTPGADDRPSLRVFLQRGPDAGWVTELVPDETERKAMAQIYDPTGKTREIGDTLRLEVSLPGDVVTSGVLPAGRGIEASREGRRAVLLIPVRTALTGDGEMVWDISWR